MKKSSTKKYFIFSILFLLVSITLFFFMYQKVQDNEKISNEKEVEWYNYTTNQDKIDVLDNLLQETFVERGLLESHFAKSSDLVSFLDEIENLASSVGAQATISTVDPAKEEIDPAIGMRVVGPFDSIYRFMILLENHTYELEIISFSMQQVNNPSLGESALAWNANFKIKLLSFSR